MAPDLVSAASVGWFCDVAKCHLTVFHRRWHRAFRSTPAIASDQTLKESQGWFNDRLKGESDPSARQSAIASTVLGEGFPCDQSVSQGLWRLYGNIWSLCGPVWSLKNLKTGLSFWAFFAESWIIHVLLPDLWVKHVPKTCFLTTKELQQGDPNLLPEGLDEDGPGLTIADVTGDEFVHQNRGPPCNWDLFSSLASKNSKA